MVAERIVAKPLSGIYKDGASSALDIARPIFLSDDAHSLPCPSCMPGSILCEAAIAADGVSDSAEKRMTTLSCLQEDPGVSSSPRCPPECTCMLEDDRARKGGPIPSILKHVLLPDARSIHNMFELLINLT